MLPVYIRISHQDNLVIPGLARIKVFPDARAKRGNHGLHFGVSECPVKPCLLHVQDLSAERQDRLCLRIASSLCGASGGVALNDEDFGKRRILARAVRELARHSPRFKQSFASGGFSSLSSGEPCSRGLNCLSDNIFCSTGVTLKPVPELVTHDLLNESFRLRVAELCLRLPLELRFTEFHRKNCSEALAHILTGEILIFVSQEVLLPRIPIDQCGQRCTKSLFMGATFVRIDRICIGVNALRVGRCPLHRDFRRNSTYGVL